MKGGALYAVYFSPTGGTRRCVRLIAGRMGEILGREAVGLDLTGSERRKQRYSFGGEDLVVLGAPVYAGRVPNKILPDLEAGLGGAGDTKIVPVSVYGNRSCGEALRELIVLTERNGFVPIGGAAVVSRHVFSQTLAAGRPDPSDGAELAAFGERMARRVKTGGRALNVDRTRPAGPYYTPLKEDGTPARFLKAKPLTDGARCAGCGLCSAVCPMGSISRSDFTQVTGVCIKCQACIRACPAGAKYFDDPDFLSHVTMLERTCTARKDNLFLEA